MPFSRLPMSSNELARSLSANTLLAMEEHMEELRTLNSDLHTAVRDSAVIEHKSKIEKVS